MELLRYNEYYNFFDFSSIGGMKILICDDSAVARKLISRSIVQDTSLHLLEAQDGHEALKILAEQNIDVFVSRFDDADNGRIRGTRVSAC